MTELGGPLRGLAWRTGQCAWLIAACAGAWGLLAVAAIDGGPEGPERTAPSAARVAAAQQGIDPNIDPLASLIRLPGVGPARAEAILEYRRTYGPAAFRRAEDLRNIRGIGPATVEELRPHLKFPPEGDSPLQPATARP